MAPRATVDRSWPYHRLVAGLLAIHGFGGAAACRDEPTEPSNGVASVTIEPGNLSLDALGVTVQLVATARSSSGEVVPNQTFIWSSDDTDVATVSTSGLVMSEGNGNADIKARTGTMEGAVTVSVQQVARTIAVSPASVELSSVGETAQFTAFVADALGHEMEPAIEWTSSDESVVSVNGSGLAVAVGPGSALIEARVGQLADDAAVHVDIGSAFASISAGSDHTCALDEQGVAWCWGSNTFGQLGNGSTVRSLEPVRVEAGVSFVSISAGYGHTCAVAVGGELWCWGNSDRGQVGDGGLGQRTLPSRVLGGVEYVAVEAGRAHTCGLAGTGQVLCWGWGGNGEMGNGLTANRVVPDTVSGGGRYSALGGSAHTICAVRTSGHLDCWGRNNTGQVGDGTVTCTSLSSACFSERASPTRVQTTLEFTGVSAGARIANGFGGGTACALAASGTIHCWGQNGNGQIGDGTQTARLTPVPVSGGTQWQAVDVGTATVCGLTSAGIAQCWGYNATGTIGDGTSIQRLVPVAVAGSRNFMALSVGVDHTCGVTTGGSVYCWGANSSGQLGDGTTTTRLVPVGPIEPG